MALKQAIVTIQYTLENNDDFEKLIKEISKRHEPRGCR